MSEGFPERLRRLRKQKGLSQTDLGNIVEMHYNHIGRYERGDSRPKGDALARLAQALGVSTDYLLDGETQRAAVADFEDLELLQQFQAVQAFPPDDKDLVKRFLDAFITKKRLEEMIAR